MTWGKEYAAFTTGYMLEVKNCISPYDAGIQYKGILCRL